MLDLRWLMVGALLFSGCSIPVDQASVASARAMAQADCARADGVWREVLNFCEYRSGCR